MQVAIIEFARHVCGYNDAHSIELDPNTTHPVIALMPDQNGVEDIGGTLRLGAYPCVLDKDSKACKVYGTTEISERHRHRYEVNNDYRTALVEHGMKLCGTSPDGQYCRDDRTSRSSMVHCYTGASGTEIQTKPSTPAFPWICRGSNQM